jgi:hypothetical protein
MCHLGRLSGTLTAWDRAERVTVRFRDGDVVGAETAGASGQAAVFAFLAWDQGQFDFAPGDPGDGAALGDSFDQLLLEGCRRLDEGRRSGQA